MSKTIKSIDKYRFNTFSKDNSEETIEITGELLSHFEYDKYGDTGNEVSLKPLYDLQKRIGV